MGIKKSIQEKFLFLYKFLYKPGQIGSVMPSSKFLAQKMVERVPWHEVYAVAELGAGTGAITKYIQEAVHSQTKVFLFEKDPYMLKTLEKNYPNFVCYENSTNLQAVLNQEGIEQLDCVISGLPFFNFNQTLRDMLMEQIVKSLKDQGLFIAFQYSQQMKKQLSTHFHIEEIKFVPLNVPPAFVYICRKKQQR
ncbi:class I SAM-dependent methyltransferase [Bacillus sp. FJAT-28004]|uniref:class I SAM-dependent methyltransferase n=1 Tax=Bacillus sp. FJAT-28004 TaxID=1679165 RepID=UPI0006B65E5D|nr:methyltransferase [Bacillus sp. FJAT-28004]